MSPTFSLQVLYIIVSLLFIAAAFWVKTGDTWKKIVWRTAFLSFILITLRFFIASIPKAEATLQEAKAVIYETPEEAKERQKREALKEPPPLPVFDPGSPTRGDDGVYRTKPWQRIDVKKGEEKEARFQYGFKVVTDQKKYSDWGFTMVCFQRKCNDRDKEKAGEIRFNKIEWEKKYGDTPCVVHTEEFTVSLRGDKNTEFLALPSADSCRLN
jgi:hypothetical protein